MAQYLVYRHGSNAANQSRTPRMPVAVVEADDTQAALRVAYDLPWDVAGCYNNQYLFAEPVAGVPAAHVLQAHEHQAAYSAT